MDNNFSALGLETVPNIIKIHMDNISRLFQSMTNSANSLASLVPSGIGSNWSEIASIFSRINSKSNAITDELIERINTYIETTLENERRIAEEIQNLNDNIESISRSLDNITF